MLFNFILYVPFNNFSAMSVTQVRLKPTTNRSRGKYSTTLPLRSDPRPKVVWGCCFLFRGGGGGTTWFNLKAHNFQVISRFYKLCNKFGHRSVQSDNLIRI